MILSNDQIYYVLSLIVSVPAAGLYRYLPTHPNFIWMKHVLGVIWSFIVYTIVFGMTSFFTGLLPVICVWLLGIVMNTLDDKSIKRKWLCIGTWITCMLYLAIYHLSRMMNNYLLSNIDSTTTQMIITIKLTQFITEVYYRKHQSYPTFIEWLGFIYFIPSVLAGPALSYDEYNKFTSNVCGDNKIGNRIRHLTVKASILFTLAFIGFGWFTPQYFSTESFYHLSFRSKLVLLYITMLLMRCKYYFIWTITEMSYINSGSSTFVQYHGRNVDILDVELAGNIYTLTNAWNKKTNVWLKDYVYKPLLQSGYSKSVCILSTNLVSSVWHGFYPGYYITFVYGGIVTQLGQKLRNTVTSIVRDTNNLLLIRITELTKILLVSSLIAFGSVPFDLCDISLIFKAYHALYWYGVIIIALGWIMVLTVPRFLRHYDMLNKYKYE
jgi:lysophospholipid acyltransferase